MPLLRKLGVSTMEGDIGMIGTNIDAQENLPELERVPPGSMIDPVASFNDGPVDIKGLMKTIKGMCWANLFEEWGVQEFMCPVVKQRIRQRSS